jgi:hypothetical protein
MRAARGLAINVVHCLRIAMSAKPFPPVILFEFFKQKVGNLVEADLSMVAPNEKLLRIKKPGIDRMKRKVHRFHPVNMMGYLFSQIIRNLFDQIVYPFRSEVPLPILELACCHLNISKVPKTGANRLGSLSFLATQRRRSRRAIPRSEVLVLRPLREKRQTC